MSSLLGTVLTNLQETLGGICAVSSSFKFLLAEYLSCPSSVISSRCEFFFHCQGLSLQRATCDTVYNSQGNKKQDQIKQLSFVLPLCCPDSNDIVLCVFIKQETNCYSAITENCATTESSDT